MRYVQSVHQLMLARIRFGALGGVPLSIHWTWFPFVILLSVLDRGNFTSTWWRLTELLALFAIVLLHEIGHVLAARWRRVAMREIVMIPFGGFAIGAIPPRWKDEFLIVAAGPAVNALLVPLMYLLFYKIGYTRGGDISLLFWRLLWLNNVMLVFNLLPIWPLDGGRLAQSLLSGWIGLSRSQIIIAVVGFGGALAGSMVCSYLGMWLAVGIFVMLLFSCVALADSAQRMFRIERKWGVLGTAACPACGNHPIDGPTGRCDSCGEANNAFYADGRCWRCGRLVSHVMCWYCRAKSPLELWRQPAAPVRAVEVVPLHDPHEVEQRSRGLR